MSSITMMQITECVKKIEQLDNLENIWNEFTSMSNKLGFDYVVYTIANRCTKEFYHYDNIGLHDSDSENFYDPFLDYCCHSYDTMYTGIEFIDLHAAKSLPPKAYALIRRAARLGMTSGLAIPLRLSGSIRYGGFNLGSNLERFEFETLCESTINVLQVGCLLVNRHIEAVLDKQGILIEHVALTKSKADDTKVSMTTNPTKLTNLTPRENDILHKIATGYSRKECANTLFLSESTISTHVKNIYRKLGVSNRVQATNVALGHSLN